MRKDFLIKALSLILILGAITSFSCKKKEEKVILSEKTKLPEENPDLQKVIIRGDTLRFIYKAGAKKPEFKSGDILIGQTDEGYLKKVLSTTTRGDTLILITEQASLTDAIKKCEIETTFALFPEEKRKMGSIKEDTTFTDREGRKYQMTVQSDDFLVEPIPEQFEFKIKLPNMRIEIRDISGNLAAFLAADTVILTKRVDINIGVQIDWFEVKEFHCIAHTSDGLEFKNAQVGLEKSITKEVEKLLKSLPLGKVVICAGPVPVVFIFSLDVYGGVDANLSISVSCNISNQINLNSNASLGARYTDGDWSPVNNWTLTGDADFYTSPGGSISASLEGFIKGGIASKLYGVAGPYLYVKPYQYDELTYPPFEFELGVGLGAGLAFQVKILSWRLAEFNWTFADFKKELIHSTTPPANNPPNTPQTPSGPSSGQVNVSYNFTTSTTDPDGDSVAYQFDWGDGNQSNWSSFLPSGTSITMAKSWSNAGTYSIKARAKDKKGGISDWSNGHQITISATGGALDTLVNDDGSPVGAFNDLDYYASRFSPVSRCILKEAMIAFYVPRDSSFISQLCSLFIWSNTSSNTPGNRLAVGTFLIPTIPSGYWAWVIADLSSFNLSFTTDFWIGYKKLTLRPPFGLSDGTPSYPNKNMYTNSPQSGWNSWTAGDFLVRAIVEYTTPNIMDTLGRMYSNILLLDKGIVSVAREFFGSELNEINIKILEK
ncbi:MAG: PKD domain-containing protein [candidate division WOR-3 bacterium]